MLPLFFAVSISAVEIDPAHAVIVRVQDKAGQGGIWRPVFLAAREKSK